MSRKFSRKRADDRLSDIPEQIQPHGSESVSEGPILVRGERMITEGHPTMEHGNGGGAEHDAAGAKVATQAS